MELLEQLLPQIREHTHRNLVTTDLYYTGVELEKCNLQRTHIQRTEKAITEATLIPWIAGLRGPKTAKGKIFIV